MKFDERREKEMEDLERGAGERQEKEGVCNPQTQKRIHHG